MNLTFDNLQELDAFLQWASCYGGYSAPAAPPETPYPKIDGTLIDGVAEAGSDGAVAFDTPPADTRMPPPVSGDPSGAAAQPTEPVKRKRRTKAEIAADEQAAKVAAADAVRTAGAAVAAEGANPFETAAGTDAPSDGGTPAGDVAGEEVVTPFQHLTRAREFIGKHGMQKYNESFAKAGLDPNVMTYTAYQRALHLDALNALEAA